MARHNKIGLEFFSHDTDISNNDKVALIEAEFGLKGYAIYLKLLEKIYGDKGYYCEWNEDIKLILAKSVNESACLVGQIVSRLCSRSLFDNKLATSAEILTSDEIQRRYLEAVSRREKVQIIKEFCLLDISEYKNAIYVSRNEIDVNRNAHSKVEYSTVIPPISPSGESQLSKPEIPSQGEKNLPPVPAAPPPARVPVKGDPPVSPDEVEKVVEKYNSSCTGMDRVVFMTDKRRSAINARIREHGLEKVLEAINKASKSTFLAGQNNRGWTADFEWIMRPGNFVKVLEGKYDTKNTQTDGSRTHPINKPVAGPADFANDHY